MKKILMILMVLMLVGCQNTQNEDSSSSQDDTKQTEEITSNQTEKDQKILVAYFSRVGNTDFPSDVDTSSSASVIVDGDTLVGSTEYIANVIVEQTGGDKFLIETQTKYSAYYDELVDQQQGERNKNARPALASHVKDFDSYDVIYLGFPNWWYGMPMPLYTFLEEYDFSGKIIIPFNTSGGSGFSDAISEIEDLCPNATVLDGYTTSGSSVQNDREEISEWINEVSQ